MLILSSGVTLIFSSGMTLLSRSFNMKINDGCTFLQEIDQFVNDDSDQLRRSAANDNLFKLFFLHPFFGLKNI